MFRLNDAARRYQAQLRPPMELKCVAATVTTLSPRTTPSTVKVVASVAVVATPTSEPIDIARLIEQLQEERALLQHNENALLIRPSHWGQLDSITLHWKALLLFLQTTAHGEEDSAGRSA